MNRLELLTRVKELLGMEPTSATVESGNPTNTRIKSAIEEARGMLYNRLREEMPRRFAASTTVAYTAQAESVALPAAAQGAPVFKVEFLRTGETLKQTLDPAVIEEFRNFSVNGDPRVFAVVGNNIHLRPRPGTAGTVTLWHAPALTALGDSDSPTEIPASFHHVIAYAAAIRLGRAMRDDVDGLEKQYDEDMRVLLAHFEGLARDNHVHEVESSEYYNV